MRVMDMSMWMHAMKYVIELNVNDKSVAVHMDIQKVEDTTAILDA